MFSASKLSAITILGGCVAELQRRYLAACLLGPQ